MRTERLLDCRLPRQDLSVTFASSHPELTTGEFAMRPRVLLNSADQESVARWSWGFAVAVILIAVVTLALPGLRNGSQASLPDDSSVAQLETP
jgi:hypothetical protein